jgi:hypothetical protein
MRGGVPHVRWDEIQIQLWRDLESAPQHCHVSAILAQVRCNRATEALQCCTTYISYSV